MRIGPYEESLHNAFVGRQQVASIADIQHEEHPSEQPIACLGQNVEGVSRWLRVSWAA